MCSVLRGIAGARRFADDGAALVERHTVDAPLRIVERTLDPGQLLLGERIGRAALDVGEALVIGLAERLEGVAQIVHGERQVAGLGLRGKGLETG